MDFNGINLPDLTPRIDTSFIDEMNRRNQEVIDSITPLNEILAEEIKPILVPVERERAGRKQTGS